LQDTFCHFADDLGPAHALGRGKEVHLQTLSAQTDLVQQRSDMLDPPFGSQITLQVMTGAAQSTRHQDAVSALFKGTQQVERIHLASAGQSDDLDAGRVIQPHRPGQVSGSIGTVVARKSQDLRLKLCLNVHSCSLLL
jgi:hypothetical protein